MLVVVPEIVHYKIQYVELHSFGVQGPLCVRKCKSLDAMIISSNSASLGS
jgi:hypothetical protein